MWTSDNHGLHLQHVPTIWMSLKKTLAQVQKFIGKIDWNNCTLLYSNVYPFWLAIMVTGNPGSVTVPQNSATKITVQVNETYSAVIMLLSLMLNEVSW